MQLSTGHAANNALDSRPELDSVGMRVLSTSHKAAAKVVKACGSCKCQAVPLMAATDQLFKSNAKGPAYAASKDYAYNSETETILANDKADLAEAWEGTECGQSFQYRPLTSFDLFAECVVCCFCLYSSG